MWRAELLIAANFRSTKSAKTSSLNHATQTPLGSLLAPDSDLKDLIKKHLDCKDLMSLCATDVNICASNPKMKEVFVCAFRKLNDAMLGIRSILTERIHSFDNTDATRWELTKSGDLKGHFRVELHALGVQFSFKGESGTGDMQEFMLSSSQFANYTHIAQKALKILFLQPVSLKKPRSDAGSNVYSSMYFMFTKHIKYERWKVMNKLVPLFRDPNYGPIEATELDEWFDTASFVDFITMIRNPDTFSMQA